ncbi:VCBS repeat-containing protein [Fodinicola feengrottensis]|uniref:VCBS repeat-containing protein n=1 Tax=Fodinicola feengrottensis TaxID=435914 RepID=A0ABN2GJJ7_9ACTN
MTGRTRTAALIAAAILALSVPATGASASGPLPPRHRLELSATNHRPTAKAAVSQAGASVVAGHPDAISDQLWIYPHNGATSGNPWTSRTVAGGQWRFADVLLVGDVTGDGHPDVVARDPAVDNGTLWIYPNNGSTTGNPWTSRFSAGTGWNIANAIMLADVTGDGHPDIVARDPAVDNGTLWIYPHNGSTTANPWTSRFWAGTGWNLATALMLGDVTGDGHPEIVARDATGSLWIYPNSGALTSNPWTSSRYPAGTGWNLADTLMLGDVTGDGRPDVVARDRTGALWIYPGNGSTAGNPWTTSRVAAGIGWQLADRLILADVTGDGHLDIVARPGGDLWLYPYNGSANGNPWTSRISAGTSWGAIDDLAIGDVTNDGHLDLVARDPSLDNGTLFVYPGDGSVTANPWTAAPVAAGTGWDLATALAVGDLTGDGHRDVLARDASGNLWIYPNNGGTTGNPFTVARQWAGTGWNTAKTLALGDVDGDGVADLIDQEQDGSMWIYLAATPNTPVRVDGDWTATNAVAVADVDGTGKPNLITRDTSGSLWIYANNGSSTTNPWTTRRTAGTTWQYAGPVLL